MPQPEKKKVQCPDCETEITIYAGDDGICMKCGLNVQAVYEKLRHEQALEKVKKAQQPVKKETKSPFDFRM